MHGATSRWTTRVALFVMLAWTGVQLVGSRSDLPSERLTEDQGSVAKFSYPMWRGAVDWLGAKKFAVLTFDDGPYGRGVDERILEILRRHRAHAMFFVVCNRLDGGRRHILGEITAGGHMVENHSWDHAHMKQMSATGLLGQIERCSAEISDLTGQRPKFFRPPFGETSIAVQQAAQIAGMSQMLWNANSQDSWQKRPEQILYWTREQTDDGSIVLLHDSPTTAAVLDRVLTDLENRGFRFVLPESGPQSSLRLDARLPSPAK
jgi:peptidoglycan/xylan/chitin deacetylase (PgdA/CDA1 family)